MVRAADDGRARAYIAIDLKSFYASVECVDRGLDPLTTNLVVADESRTEKTICLAVSPSLKAHGIGGRARLFEVVERMGQVNEMRRLKAPGHRLVGRSCDARDLARNPRLKETYVIAPPRMAHYMRVSAEVYGVYLRYAAPEDIHVYSIDEVFIDATRYLKARGMGAHEMARAIVRDIVARTGLTATAGIGTNLYLAKVAMDILAKHEPADADGVRVAELDERSYRKRLWAHRPLTDFWRVGRGYARKLEAKGLLTMGDIARCSLGRASDFLNEDLLHRMFGVNAELLIDHAWGWEPTTIADIKDYRPDGHSISSGQVLTGPADFDTARLIVKEMADSLSLDLVDKGLVAGRLTLAVGYDIASLDADKLDACADEGARRLARRAAREYAGSVTVDRYGRRTPKPAAGSVGLGVRTSSSTRFRQVFAALCDAHVNPLLLVRRITVIADDLAEASDPGGMALGGHAYEQPGLFDEESGNAGSSGLDANGGWLADSAYAGAGAGGTGVRCRLGGDASHASTGSGKRSDSAEADVQQALLDIKRKFGRNAVIKAMDMEPGATGQDRNRQIGGHLA